MLTEISYSRAVKQKAEVILSRKEGHRIERIGEWAYRVVKNKHDVYLLDWVGTPEAACSCPSTRPCSHMMAAGIHKLRSDKNA